MNDAGIEKFFRVIGMIIAVIFLFDGLIMMFSGYGDVTAYGVRGRGVRQVEGLEAHLWGVVIFCCAVYVIHYLIKTEKKPGTGGSSQAVDSVPRAATLAGLISEAPRNIILLDPHSITLNRDYGVFPSSGDLAFRIAHRRMSTFLGFMALAAICLAAPVPHLVNRQPTHAATAGFVVYYLLVAAGCFYLANWCLFRTTTVLAGTKYVYFATKVVRTSETCMHAPEIASVFRRVTVFKGTNIDVGITGTGGVPVVIVSNNDATLWLARVLSEATGKPLDLSGDVASAELLA